MVGVALGTWELWFGFMIAAHVVGMALVLYLGIAEDVRRGEDDEGPRHGRGEGIPSLWAALKCPVVVYKDGV